MHCFNIIGRSGKLSLTHAGYFITDFYKKQFFSITCADFRQFFLKNRLLEQFWVHSKIKQSIQFPLRTQNLIIDIPYQSGALVTNDEPAVTHHNQPKLVVYIMILSVFVVHWTDA